MTNKFAGLIINLIMTILQGIFLGIVQGLTEFLPVSSSGHLVFFQKLLGLNGDFLLFNLILHMATLLAVIIVFRKTIWEIIKNPLGKKGRLIIISCIPTLILALLFKDLLQNPSGVLLGCLFLVTAVILLISQFIAKKRMLGSPIGYKHAIIMGFAQGIACFPGISRSGATIASGLISGADKNEVAEFSFLISAPVIFGGFVIELISVLKDDVAITFSAFPTILGFACAFIVGILAIKFMLKMIKNLNFAWFSAYLVIISIISFIFIK